jgi:hypothetical protein
MATPKILIRDKRFNGYSMRPLKINYLNALNLFTALIFLFFLIKQKERNLAKCNGAAIRVIKLIHYKVKDGHVI